MSWDAIVIGSGFGGALAAVPLVQAGQSVLMIERGGWVGRGPDNWGRNGAGLVTPHYTRDAAFRVSSGRGERRASAWNCVGGQSVFYGAASYRFRESDFEDNADLVEDSGAAWPFRYDDLEPFYARAEALLGVAGESGHEPGEPRRSSPFPQRPASLSRSARRIADAATRLGLTPSRIPLAISYASSANRRECVMCGKCDGYACAAESKNDLATGVIPDLMRLGMSLRANTVCVRLTTRNGHVTGVECMSRVTGERETFKAALVLLAAGTLATPHLLLASDLAQLNPASASVGRYLTRHRNAVVMGAFFRRPNPGAEFDKQIAILDLYESAGSIQQFTPPTGLVKAYLPAAVRGLAVKFTSHALGLLAIAEDQPRATNSVSVNWHATDRYGLPELRVHHEYSERDERMGKVLIDQARAILREAGALFTLVHPIRTFSHALGTVRMGDDPLTSSLDPWGRYRGLDNLFVVDGSALPRSAGLNPSLTIAANALRIGSHAAGAPAPAQRKSRHSRTARLHLPTVIAS
ncbi:MAG: GMC family oxidoreductase [Gemmatimonadaceae bacterium]